MVCLIVNTADYCSQQTVGITKGVKKSINPKFEDKIDLTTEQSEYDGVIAKAIKALVQIIEFKLEPALVQMIRIPWATLETVGDQSNYINEVTTIIDQTSTVYKQWIMNEHHYRFFCDSFCSSFIPLLTQQLYRCRRLSEVGAQQLMLDFASVKAMLNQLPNIGNIDAAPVTGRYTRHIQKEMSKAETILKIVLTPLPSFVETYKAVIPDGSESDFQKIMELKGVPRSEQRALMDRYSQQAASSGQGAGRNIRKLLTDVFPLGYGGGGGNSNNNNNG